MLWALNFDMQDDIRAFGRKEQGSLDSIGSEDIIRVEGQDFKGAAQEQNTSKEAFPGWVIRRDLIALDETEPEQIDPIGREDDTENQRQLLKICKRLDRRQIPNETIHEKEAEQMFLQFHPSKFVRPNKVADF